MRLDDHRPKSYAFLKENIQISDNDLTTHDKSEKQPILSAGNSRHRRRIEAVGYMRTSSATNVGDDKDSERRQRAAIERYAKGAGFTIVEWFYDAAVKGEDAINTRPGFAALLDCIEGNGVRTVIVEDASRFARHLMAQETGIVMLITRGVRLMTTSGDDLTDSDDPTRVMVRQILGAVSQNEKARLVDKLRKARERAGKPGGRKPYAEINPQKGLVEKALHVLARNPCHAAGIRVLVRKFDPVAAVSPQPRCYFLGGFVARLVHVGRYVDPLEAVEPFKLVFDPRLLAALPATEWHRHRGMAVGSP